jgi:hypothetical protein
VERFSAHNKVDEGIALGKTEQLGSRAIESIAKHAQAILPARLRR